MGICSQSCVLSDFINFKFGNLSVVNSCACVYARGKQCMLVWKVLWQHKQSLPVKRIAFLCAAYFIHCLSRIKCAWKGSCTSGTTLQDILIYSNSRAISLSSKISGVFSLSMMMWMCVQTSLLLARWSLLSLYMRS